MVRWLAGFAAASALTGSGAAASPAPGASIDDAPARARLVAEFDRFIPGEPTFIGVSFDIDDQWHLYWNGRNDTGFEPEITLALPPGFEAGQVQWPAPRRKVLPGDILDHIYENKLLLMVPITVPRDVPPDRTFTISAEVDWLVCKEACIPGSASLSFETRTASANRKPEPTPDSPLFAHARQLLPKHLPPHDPPVRVRQETSIYTLHAPGAGKLAFYPARECAPLPHIIEDTAADRDTLRLRIAESDTPARLAGIVEVWPLAPTASAPAPTKSTRWWVDTRPQDGRSPAAPPQNATPNRKERPTASDQ